jgi:hypothetical protein
MEEEKNNFNDELKEKIDQGLKDSTFAKRFGGEYSGSRFQSETYKTLENRDEAYKNYIAEKYGSYENFLKLQKIDEYDSVYDPGEDYLIDVRIITADSYYQTDHISAQQVIMEGLTGVCTIVFMKIDGSVGKITGTLEKQAIPSKEHRVRSQVFTPQRGDRIIMWDLVKQGWRSFYMDRVIRFVRDDTSGLE